MVAGEEVGGRVSEIREIESSLIMMSTEKGIELLNRYIVHLKLMYTYVNYT